ncbi:Flp pilus assembly protein CpaB [Bosea sp. PAMC 26642]|uniref:Flp pilus assembly protein CpaB n=1 Tax=Bosea sp. (strain PAMC 26642) TaxID=1792307 RepID=UPI0007705873|nr:Flp pilus assembly protein CpaB [Bosea sp. PAMC 26642]AMJ62716.1 hypothetical protein AXW83_22595 [Bosea sp. PAMC 26642]
MRSSSVISLGVALLFGAIAVLLARGLIQADKAPVASGGMIVVASQAVAFGSPLTAENLREIRWTGDARIEGAFASIAEINNEGRRLALTGFQRNEPILASKITAPNQRATLSTQIDEGMRAVSVRVDEVRGVAGFVLPGDRVDVILTRGETTGQDVTAAYADVLLQNAKVLAIDQSAYERPDKPTIARAVTLELNVQQAQSVILAQGIGRLSLVLRQTGQTDDKPSVRVTATDIGSAASMARPSVETERQITELKKLAEQANARADESVRKSAEIEGALRTEIENLRQAPVPTPQIAAAPLPPAPKTESVVNVTRNAAKREQYTVLTER